MAKFSGRRVQIGVGRETSRGTGVTPAMTIPQASLSHQVQVDEVRAMGALGVLADSEEKFVEEQYGQGQFEAELRDQSVGYILYSMLGSLSTTNSGDEYTHAFSLDNSNQHTSLSLYVKDPITMQLFELAMLNSFELTAEMGGLVKYTAGFLSKAPVTSGQSIPSVTDENKFSKKHVKVKIADGLGNLDAASVLDLKSLSLTIEKNAERDSVMGTADPVDILNKTFTIEGQINLNFEDSTYRDYMVNATHRSMRIDIENTDVTIDSNSPRLRFEFPSVDFSGLDIDRSLEDIVKQTINFKANYDLTNGIISTCELLNEKTSY